MADFTNKIVNLQITRQTKTVSQAGFGTGLAVGGNPYVTNGYEEFSSDDDVGAALGYQSPEYFAARAYFGQKPNVPPTLAVSVIPFTKIDITILKARTNHVYNVAFGDDTAGPFDVAHRVPALPAVTVPPTPMTYASYTAGSGDDTTAIATGLAAAITAALATIGQTWSGKWTAASNGAVVTITYSGSGHTWLEYVNDDLYLTAAINVAEFATQVADSPDWVAKYLGDLEAKQGDWYDFAFVYRNALWYDAAAGWVQSSARPHKLHVAWGPSATASFKTWSVYEDNPSAYPLNYPGAWRAKSYARFAQFKNNAVVMVADIVNYSGAYPVALNWAAYDTFPEFALMGRQLSINPDTTGSSTFEVKTLVGVTPDNLTDDEWAMLVGYEPGGDYSSGLHVGVYVDIGGTPVTQGFLTPSGEWLDVFTTIDWFSARLVQDEIGVLTTGEKQPYTDGGIQAFTSAISARIKSGMSSQYPHFQANYALDPTMGYSVTAPSAASVSPANKANRVLQNVRFQVELAGAIQTLILSGTVSA